MSSLILKHPSPRLGALVQHLFTEDLQSTEGIDVPGLSETWWEMSSPSVISA